MAGIYIHVPFCKTRCIYCDFYTGTDNSDRKQYVDAVVKELSVRKDYIEGEPIRTIYFGGGTPSQLYFEEFKRIFDSIYKNYVVESDAEITFEANPDDLTSDFFDSINQLPFNRLSIGVQTFSDSELKFLNRRHSAQAAIDAVKLAQSRGFDNISIDLIYGIPDQTIDVWNRNLDIALSLDIQHVSAYHLIYEERTALYRMLKKHKVSEVDEELSNDMFSLMIDRLRKGGFEHYEISNFARDEKYSKHNTSYWLGEKYLGIGPSAHSFNGKDRTWNVASLTKYIKALAKDRLDVEFEILDIDKQYNDFILTGLRTKWGVDLKTLESRFGSKMLEYCLRYAKRYLRSECLKEVDGRLILTDKGVFISDGIMSDLMFVK